MAEMMMPQMGGQEPPMQDGGQEQAPPELFTEGGQNQEIPADIMEQATAGVPQDGQVEQDQNQQQENYSFEETVQAVINFLHQTVTQQGLDLMTQTDAVKKISDSVATLINAQPQNQDAEMQQQAHYIDMHHKTRMNDLEYEGEQQRLKREEEKHLLDSVFKQQTHEQNLQQQQQKNEMNAVNNQQQLNHKQEQHQASLEQQKRDSLKSPSEAGKSK